MEKFNVQEDGFEGCLYEMEQKDESKCLILNLMFAPDSFMLYPQEIPFINLMTKLAFREYKRYPAQCRESRRQVTQEILKAVMAW